MPVPIKNKKLILFQELTRIIMIKFKFNKIDGYKYTTKLLGEIKDKYPNLSFEKHIDIAIHENKLFEIEI
jgi:hypothetical protein